MLGKSFFDHELTVRDTVTKVPANLATNQSMFGATVEAKSWTLNAAGTRITLENAFDL